MAGARLVTASETESGRVWAESQIKELTGNEAPVSARHPYGRPFTYKPQYKLQFVGNHAPNSEEPQCRHGTSATGGAIYPHTKDGPRAKGTFAR